jgi:hypothetical protein
MKTREVVIVLGVLGPFAVLLVFLLRGQLTPAPAREELSEPLLGAPETARVATPTRPPPLIAAAPSFDAGAVDDVPPELAAPLAAVTPEVRRCFDDQRAHLRGPQRLAVRFTPTRDGGFSDLSVQTGGSPYLSACVEDVFQELTYTPTGAETFRPATHTFVFDPQAH